MNTRSAVHSDSLSKALVWSLQDVEQRFGFRGGRFTQCNGLFTMLLGIVFSCVFYAIIVFVLATIPATQFISKMFLRPDNLPAVIPITLLFFWSVAMLLVKLTKLDLQTAALQLSAVPHEPEFTLTEDTARTVLERVHSAVDHPRHFVLLNRIECALSNLSNIGQVSDVSSILRSQAENDEDMVSSSYGLVNGFVWAMPVLGFIGTVLGLSVAIGAFGSTLASSADLGTIKSSLQGVVGGLSTAFETTLIALVGSLMVQLGVTFMQQRELSFLDDCNDYCQVYVISKLRLKDRLASPTSDAKQPTPAAIPQGQSYR
ncbi:MAG: MotA/TolQ/ExbB proton channel family protein [Candidatus Methylacidiphilales bacterium]|nr:MotA/TolQ/ExbB proton channel family protein [Candidatus Methylacidiphilales bacterium]